MNDEIKMNVSPVFRKGGSKSIYVLFEDGDKKAELCIPDPGEKVRVMRNEGFSETELGELLEYTDSSRDDITGIAGRVTPLKAFLGQEQG